MPLILLCGATGGLARLLLFMLGCPDPGFSHLMLATCSALITPTALGPLLAFASSATLTLFSTFIPLLTLTPHPIEFLLPIFAPTLECPGPDFFVLLSGRVLHRGHREGLAGEASWLTCTVLLRMEKAVIWPMFGHGAIGVGSPSL